MRRPAESGRKKVHLPGEEWLTRRPGSPDYHYDISIQDRRFRRTCGTADKALAAALAQQEHDRLYREIVLGEVPVQHITLNAAAVRYYDEVARATAYGERAQRYQLATLIELLGRDLRLADLTDAVVNDVVQALKRRRLAPRNMKGVDPKAATRPCISPATINRHLTTLSAVCRRAREMWGVEVGDWTLGQHKQREPEGREVFLDHGQARALWDAAVPHLRPILLLELTTGLRKGNVHALRWEEVSLPMARLVLVQKGDRRLSVDLVPAAVALLETLQPDETKRRGPVFKFGDPATACWCNACKAKKGQPIQGTKRAFATAVQAAGLGEVGLRFHDLRHTFASMLLAATGDLKLVQEALGHRNIATTTRYAHLGTERKAAAIAGATAGLMLDGPTGVRKKG